MYEGKIIEYIDQGSFLCTLCLQDKGGRLHLLTPHNREVNLAPKRALLTSRGSMDLSRSREDLLSSLKMTEAARKDLRNRIDVIELWELVRDEQEYFSSKYLAELCFGDSVSDDHISALVRSLFEDKLYFKMKDGLFFPNTEARIEQILRQREEEAAKEELLAEGSLWLTAILEERDVREPACREEVIDLLIDLAVFGKESARFKDGRALLLRAGITDIGEARNILIKLGVWDEDQNLDLIRFDIKIEFGQEVLRASRGIEGLSPENEGREDLRDLAAFTIDGPVTKDFDDALSLEIKDGEYRLGIHIADVAGAISEDHILDREASLRGSSLYLPCLQVPMLPHELSQDILSLRQDCDRAVLSLLCDFDEDGNLIDYRFTPGVIRVRRRLDYDQVDTMYQDDETLSALNRLTGMFHRRRIDQGAMVLSLPEIIIQIQNDSTIHLETVDQNTPARTMVAECMILYNWLSARFCRDYHIPILYRGQEPPGEKMPVDKDNYVFFVFKQRRKLSPLMIDTDPRPHAGLGLDLYTNASSPIRRYADMLVQRQMRKVLLGGLPVYREEDLEKKRMALGSVLRDLEIVKRKRFRYWMQKYLLQRTGDIFSAVILNELKNRYRLLLPDLQLVVEMKRQNGQNFQEGQHFQIKICKSDPWNDLLKVEYAGPLNKPTSTRA